MRQYDRVLIKFSGEFLSQDHTTIHRNSLDYLATDISSLNQQGVRLGIVVGAGNFIRGAASTFSRVTGDQMGMLATMINALALCDVLQQAGTKAIILSAKAVEGILIGYSRTEALTHLQSGYVVIFAGGTGHPFLTTDSAASLRALEMNAQLMIKATKVNGIYSADPMKDTTAQHYAQISYDDAIVKQLHVMDMMALALCRDNRLPIRVASLEKKGTLQRIINGENEGSLISHREVK